MALNPNYFHVLLFRWFSAIILHSHTSFFLFQLYGERKQCGCEYMFSHHFLLVQYKFEKWILTLVQKCERKSIDRCIRRWRHRFTRALMAIAHIQEPNSQLRGFWMPSCCRFLFFILFSSLVFDRIVHWHLTLHISFILSPSYLHRETAIAGSSVVVFEKDWREHFLNLLPCFVGLNAWQQILI